MKQKKDAGFRHDKSLGQNFLSDGKLLDTLVDLSGVTEWDGVLEVGAGMGDLSERLAARAENLTTVEVDERLHPFVRLKLEKYPRARLIADDVRKVNLPALMEGMGGSVRVVANLPYYLTTPLMEAFMTPRVPALKSVSVMVQKEAGRRLLAGAGEDGRGELAVLCEIKAVGRAVLDVPAECFTPPPKVDSVFIRFDMRETPLVAPDKQADFMKLVRAGFAKKRKTLLNNLLAGTGMARADIEGIIEQANLPPTVRAEEIGAKEWLSLYALIHPGR